MAQKNSNEIYQGDVGLTKIEAPQSPVEVARGAIVISRGETSGHVHVIEGVVEFKSSEGKRLLWVEAQSELKHVHESSKTLTGKHGTISVARGWYVVEEQMQWDSGRVMRALD